MVWCLYICNKKGFKSFFFFFCYNWLHILILQISLLFLFHNYDVLNFFSVFISFYLIIIIIIIIIVSSEAINYITIFLENLYVFIS